MISGDVYPFLAFSDLTCHLGDTGIGVLPHNALCRLIVRRPNLEVATERVLHHQANYAGVVLVLHSRMEERPYSYFRWCGYF